MNYTSVFHLISDISKKISIPCVLIGGFAVNFYKFSRQTADVDFLITEEDFKKILSMLEEAGYKQDFREDVFIKLKSDRLYLMDIDFMFVDKDTLIKIIKDSREITISSYKFIIPSLNNLIALKLHSLKYNYKIRQTKDLPDIIGLIKMNNLNARSEEFRQICMTYGTEEIYNKILENIIG